MIKHFIFFLLLTAITGLITAQLPNGIQLLPTDVNTFSAYGPEAPKLLVEEIEVTGQSFIKGLRINTFNKTNSNGDYGLTTGIKMNLKAGDVLWISFKARSLESKRETGESFVELRFDQLVNGKYQWPSHLERGISIGRNWAETSIPFVLKKDVSPADVRLIIKFDSYAQRFEIGAVSFINFGQNIKPEELPRSVVHYDGDATDAPWRKAAAERIEKYRKGNFTIAVNDENGKPVKDATVSVKLKKSSFGWGTATNSGILSDTVNLASKKYRDTLLRYFNKVVFENEMKAKNWARTDFRQTIKAVNWLKAHDIDVRGHVMVWPSWKNSPHLAQFDKDTAALRKAVLKNIYEQTMVMKNQFTEWDVVNEPFANHNIMDSLGGKKVMIDWFKAAKANTAGVTLFLNEFTMFHTQGTGSDDFYNNVKFLVDNGAPIEGIGEQSHIGGTPPGIDFILNKLDRFALFGLPIQITEFDVNSDDEDFKSRYLRDYFTAIFSHPSAMGIVQWGFWEPQHWMPAAALWDKAWNIRPSGKVFTELVSKTWNTTATGTTNKNGLYNIRGFTGDYEVVVTKGNKVVSKQAALDNKGAIIKVMFPAVDQ